MKILSLIGLLILSVQGCNPEQATQPMPSQREINRSMEEINRRMAQEEESAILTYIEEKGWQMTKTGTGMFYQIYENGTGPVAKEGQAVTVDYEVSLTDGSVVYTSEEEGTKTFVIGRAHVESGLHEAMSYLRVGDRAHIILPSHLAHGLTGDNNKIPARSTVVYDIHLLNIQ